ncbi:MAG: MerR family transcriptional regulator [Actinomycetota bacterium]|nr:MerR family transcriptional regulator [Actinomycetota bacterium]
MPLSRTRDYMSIGEVLDAVREDFPDVSISKIRFLETEGLISPERTPSGYRKFFPDDVSTLRHILSLQRDHFMPLKVIKEHLANGPDGPTAPPAPPARRRGGVEPKEAPPVVTDVAMTKAELQKASGLSAGELQSLEEYGILAPSDAGTYDGWALAAASAAKSLFNYGVEARHLRMYRQFAERETSFVQQIVTPVARRRDPEAQTQASEAARELVALCQRLHDAMLRSSAGELV